MRRLSSTKQSKVSHHAFDSLLALTNKSYQFKIQNSKLRI
ncbi:hypothetical protein FDUTEX481_01745 [Tolypothrix sp. PCC 7601]|nr:hypothetical protein FDUTEX481_01745 [Tolypothrix sp. PCC 7601]